MGIKQVTKFLRSNAPSSIIKVELSAFKGKTVAIDLSIFMYKYLHKSESKIKGFVELICKLTKNNIRPIFILDGMPTEEKRIVLNNRKEILNDKKYRISEISEELSELLHNQSLEDYLNNNNLSHDELKKITELQAEHLSISNNLIEISKDDKHDIMSIIKLLGIPLLKAKGEADFLCCKL